MMQTAAQRDTNIFVTEPIMRNVLVMTLTSSLGLIAMFAVDLIDLYFLSRLGIPEIAAAVGISGSLLFFTSAITMGTMVAMSSVVSRALGAHQRDKAARMVVSTLILGSSFSVVVVILVLAFLDEALTFVGAEGKTFQLAKDYLVIILPSLPIMVIGMSMAGVLRALGQAKHAMYATLVGGAVNACFDPLLIFVFEMNIEGAAWASVLSRIAIGLYASWMVIAYSNLNIRLSLGSFFSDAIEIMRVEIPAVLSSMTAPIGGIFIMATLTSYGDNAVTGYSVIGRISPVAFAIVFGLPMSIGPILGQNLGALKMDRVRSAIKDAIILSALVVGIIGLGLLLSKPLIVSAFNIEGDAAELVEIFCYFTCFAMFFRAILFIANAAFNSLGFPNYATAINISATLLGTIPFVALGSKLMGVNGVIIFEALSTIVFSLFALFLLRRLLNTLDVQVASKAVQAGSQSEMSEHHIQEALHVGCTSSQIARYHHATHHGAFVSWHSKLGRYLHQKWSWLKGSMSVV